MAADFKTRLYEILEGVRARDPVAKISEILLVSLIAANVAAVVLETVPDLVTDYQRFFEVFETISVVIFTVEYLGRLWTSTEQPGRQDQAPWSTRLRYMLTPMALIDLISILPFYLAMFFAVDLRFMRVFRLLRILKLTRHSAALSLVGAVLYAERRALLAAGTVMLVLLVFASSLVYLVEREAQPVAFASIPHAMWWGVATLTTVGYGDIAPITALGKLLGAVVTLLGVGMFAMPAGILASGFAQAVRSRDFVVSWSMVAEVPLFSKLEAVRIAEIVSILRPRLAVPGEVIVRQGDEANCMYFITSGEVRVALTPSVLLGAGDFFGELALLSGDVRTTTVVADSSCQLLELTADDFRRMMDSNQDMGQAMHRIAEQRRAELGAETPAARSRD
jgi:voltage-gated potassium channel